jgi:hypothetical protein
MLCIPVTPHPQFRSYVPPASYLVLAMLCISVTLHPQFRSYVPATSYLVLGMLCVPIYGSLIARVNRLAGREGFWGGVCGGLRIP